MSSERGEKDNINNINNIDIAIVMDCTGSMQTWIDAAKDTAIEAFDEIRKQYTYSTIRLGLICYRDIGDDERFIVSPLTENIESIQEVLKNVRAKGGNDTSEDVAGALEKTIDLFKEGSNEYNPVRIILLVTDAPAHGLRYHPITVGDRFPNGDPDGKDPYEQVRQLAFMGVDITIFRINDIVNMMIEEFQKAFTGTQSVFTVLDVAKQDKPHHHISSYSSSSSSSIFSSSLTNGFIDMSTYDDDYKYVYGKYGLSEVSDEKSEFKLAACKSITSAIQRRSDANKE